MHFRSTVDNLCRALNMYRLLIAGYVVGLLILSLSRLLLFIWQYDRVEASGNILQLILLGIRADIIQMGYLSIPLLLLAPLFINRLGIAVWIKLQSVWLIVAITYIVFMEAVTPAFILQYDLRPNRLFVEYLSYPKEVLSTLWGGFREWVLVSTCVLIACIYWLHQLSQRIKASFSIHQPNLLGALLVWPLLVVITLAGVRSTLAHRPANPAFFAVTNDALVNSLILSSGYSLEYALYNLRHEDNAARVYGTLPFDQVLKTVRSQAHLRNANYPYEKYPTVHFNPASRTYAKPKNIVVILEESLGATFVKDLGGLDITPNLDALRHQGWWFKNLYATGTRSVRGIEAVISGFLPTPARSTVKLSLSQHHFFTAADLLSREGYFTEFMYGGETHFDNMGSFFTGNGFHSIIGQNQINEPDFVGSWGVSDGDLLSAAHDRFEALNQRSSPFFSLVFTSSNHEPFEYPSGVIEPYQGEHHRVESAVKYADHALGEFMEKAKESSYWDSTIFLIVADHDTRVYGNELVPINKFHIPGLIVGGGIERREILEITSQIDLLPTVISLAGVSAWTASIGQDLSQKDTVPANRAMMQFGDNYAWLTEQSVIILTPGDDVSGYYDVTSKTFIEDSHDRSADYKTALAHALLPSVLYQQQAYFVPKIAETEP